MREPPLVLEIINSLKISFYSKIQSLPRILCKCTREEVYKK